MMAMRSISFNRTSVELKLFMNQRQPTADTHTFNRTSVELKRSGTTSSMRPTQTFNRTSVELKLDFSVDTGGSVQIF